MPCNTALKRLLMMAPSTRIGTGVKKPGDECLKGQARRGRFLFTLINLAFMRSSFVWCLLLLQGKAGRLKGHSNEALLLIGEMKL